MPAIIGFFMFLLWLGLIIFMFTMIYRLVKAVERIAERSDNSTLILKDIAESIKKPINE